MIRPRKHFNEAAAAAGLIVTKPPPDIRSIDAHFVRRGATRKFLAFAHRPEAHASLVLMRYALSRSRSSRTILELAVIAQLPLAAPRVSVVSWDRADGPQGRPLGRDQNGLQGYVIGSGEFAERFRVWSEDASFAERILNTAAQQAILELPLAEAVHVELSGDLMIASSELTRQVGADQFVPFFDLATQLRDIIAAAIKTS